MSKSKLKTRYIFIEFRTRNKKRQYYILVKKYDPSFNFNKPELFSYPCFKKTFSSKSAARNYAFKMVDKLEARYKNVRFITRDLFE